MVSDSCDPMDCSPSSSSVHGIFQARIWERSGFTFPSPGDLPYPWVESMPFVSLVLMNRFFFTTVPPGKT